MLVGLQPQMTKHKNKQTKMKQSSYLIGLLLLAAGLFVFVNNNKIQAQGNQRLPRSFIILSDTDVFHRGPNQEYIQTGLKVFWVEADQYAPEIKAGDRLADTIAKCLDLGYSYEWVPGRYHILKR